MAITELGKLHAWINETIPDGAVWTYRQTLRGGRVNHEWTLASELGGVHIHGFRCCYSYDRPEWLGGIEYHWAQPPEWFEGQTPLS